MGFKSVKQYNQEKYEGFLVLPNDGDYVDVIFMYQSVNDMLIADAVHYVKSPEGSGYVHCLGRGCPACLKNLRVEPKFFIPVYVIEKDEVIFWDRTPRFQNVILPILEKFANPSEYVFRITRHGAAGDANTKYSIQAISKNTVKSYFDICRDKQITFPEYYDTICKDVSSQELNDMLNSGTDESDLGDYMATPRKTISASSVTGDSTSDEAATNIPEADPIDIPDSVDDVGEEGENLKF